MPMRHRSGAIGNGLYRHLRSRPRRASGAGASQAVIDKAIASVSEAIQGPDPRSRRGSASRRTGSPQPDERLSIQRDIINQQIVDLENVDPLRDCDQGQQPDDAGRDVLQPDGPDPSAFAPEIHVRCRCTSSLTAEIVDDAALRSGGAGAGAPVQARRRPA